MTPAMVRFVFTIFLLCLATPIGATAGYEATYGRDPAEGLSSGDMAHDLFGTQRPGVPSDRDYPRPLRSPPVTAAPRADVFPPIVDDPFYGFHQMFVPKRALPEPLPSPLFAPHH